MASKSSTLLNNQQQQQIDQNDLERIFRKRLCRICRCGMDSDKFITACKCLGPFAYVHQKCFEQWLEITRQKKCDICRYEFQIQLYNRSFLEWIRYQKITNANNSKYIWSFIELSTRLQNVIFISLIGIIMVVCFNNSNYDYDDDCRLNTQHQQPETISTIYWRKFWRSLLARFIPNIRISIIIVSLIWFGWKILDEFRCWQRSNQRIQIQPFINDSPSSMMMNNVSTNDNPQDYGLLNSFVRVSGMKHVRKYLRLKKLSNISLNIDNKKDI